MRLLNANRVWSSGIRKTALAFLAASGAALILLLMVRWHEGPDGAKVFAQYCAPCHRQGGNTGAPNPDILRRMTRQDILRTFQSGVMKPEGSRLTAAQ